MRDRFVPGVCLAVLAVGAGGCTQSDANDDGLSSSGVATVTLGHEAGDGDGDGDGDQGEAGDDQGGGTRFDVGGDGDDGETGGGDTGVDPDCGGLEAVIRDFKSTHSDFEVFWGETAFTGLVLPDLGSDQKPTYNPSAVAPPGYVGSPVQITSAASFSEWYDDISGVNMRVEIELMLDETAPGSGVYVYDDDYFFPVDGLGFNDETFPDDNLDPHNFHFTTEIHTRFEYEPGQSFTFKGDDDLWMFVDGKLAIDLGGLHGALTSTADLDTLGLIAGETYDMDIFHAERRHDGSHFRIETTIDCFTPPPAG